MDSATFVVPVLTDGRIWHVLAEPEADSWGGGGPNGVP